MIKITHLTTVIREGRKRHNVYRVLCTACDTVATVNSMNDVSIWNNTKQVHADCLRSAEEVVR